MKLTDFEPKVIDNTPKVIDNTPKVYCEECIYMEEKVHQLTLSTCVHPSNMVGYSSPLRRSYNKISDEMCLFLNGDNKCKNFKGKFMFRVKRFLGYFDEKEK